jgi:two-component system sensor histidine kinase PilS (NtrC family)
MGPLLPAHPEAIPEEGEALYRKLVWLTFFRMVMITVLLGGTAVVSWRFGDADARGVRLLYGLVGGTYLLSLAFVLLLRQRRWLVGLAYGQMLVDVAIASVVMAVTGGASSLFGFMFLLVIINGSILRFRRGALFSATLAAAAYFAIAALFPGAGGRAEAQALFVRGAGFFLTAAVASYLSEQLRETGERLKASERGLKDITALHASLVQSVASGLLTIDAGGRITFLNRAGEQITGLKPSEVLGQPASHWFSALEGLEGKEERPEAEFVNLRGERLRLGYTVSPLVDGRGEAVGQAVIFQDLTQLRTMEDTVRRSERLADLGRIAAGLAHELRNPLASMSGSIELLRAVASLREEDRRLMDIVLREAGRLNQLVTSFLEFARPNPQRRVLTDIASALEETLNVFANDPVAQRAKLERDLRPATVTCDPDLMRQVFWNLLRNAAEALGTQGEIRVTCGPATGGGAVILFEDSGAGIAPWDLPKIFTPFFTTKERGTGLGLATVHRIVETHGGQVSVHSDPGRGTRFSIILPEAPPPI